jgi:hypothetical protein
MARWDDPAHRLPQGSADLFPRPDVWDTGPPGADVWPFTATGRRLLRRGAAARDNGPLGQARAARVFDALMRWHRWWHDYRDPGTLGVVAVTHPWESGRDNSPDWDEALKAVDGSTSRPMSGAI